jgi:hypothetical protein
MQLTRRLIKYIIIIISSVSAAQRGIWPPRSRGFSITHNDAPQSVGPSGRVISSLQRPSPDNTHNRQTSMPPVGFEPTIAAGERP